MGKKQRKKLARQIVKQVLRELGKMPAPAPAKKTPKQQAAEILSVVREYVITSANIAGWDERSADLLIGAGYSLHAAARAFADALQQVQ